MQPVLALFLCSSFVLFLLHIDHEQSRGVSLAVWLPTIWMLIVASKPLGVWFPFTTTVEDVTTSPLDQIALLLLVALGFLVLIRREVYWPGFVKEYLWLLLLLYYMLLSVFWSEIPFVSLKRWIRELIAVVMALVVLTEPNPRRAMQSILRRTTYILIPFSLLLVKYFPLYGVQYGRWSGEIMWIGVTMQKNGLGRLCIISGFFLFWTLWNRKQGREAVTVAYQSLAEKFIILLVLILLVGPTLQAYSATAVIAFCTGLAAFMVLSWMNKNRFNMSSFPFAVVLILIILVGASTVFLGSSSMALFTDSLGRDTTLTGRTDVWASLVPAAMQQIIVGHGFGGFWTNTTRMNYEISEAHSGYLDVLLDMGVLGLLFLSIFLVSSCLKAQKRLSFDFAWSALWICYLVMAAVHNITETSFNSLSSHFTAVLVFMAFSTATTSVKTR